MKTRFRWRTEIGHGIAFMSDRVFLDTNIFLYAHDVGARQKQRIARNLIFKTYNAGIGAISTQVLAEFFQIYVIKFGNSYIDALKELHFMSRCRVIEQTQSLIFSGISIFNEHALSLWDSMVVAAAIEFQASILFSEDMQHGQEIRGVKIVNPFS